MKLPLIIKFQFLILLLLAAGIPFAGRYLPYTIPIEPLNAVMAGNVADDPHYTYRVVVITLGLLLSLTSVAMAVVSLFTKNCSMGQRLLVAVLSLVIINIGWRLFPFYANGLMQIFGDGGTSSAFDPKDLFPCNTLGIIWPLGVMLFYVFLMLIFPVLMVVHLIVAYVKRAAGITELLVIVFYLCNYAFIWLTPNYLYWFFD